ncbi:proepiregulin-like [Carcharodon carcharias]|uniref:proepiregulin-like n=1 Tax=Carcharodon carcharias TaxID=13397 RepID=UPI001B7E7CB7|nr:proepiregulin-like [Carcharodon carcharias]
MVSSSSSSTCTEWTLLLLLEFCLYHLCDSTTIIPRCVPGQLGTECNATETPVIIPQAAEVKRSKCPPSMESFCLNGDCVYIPHENIHYCRCAKGFSGVRCMHFELVQQPISKEDVALTVAITFLVFVGLLIASYLIYMRCRKNRSKHQPHDTREKNPTTVESKEPFLGLNTLPPSTAFQNMLYC